MKVTPIWKFLKDVGICKTSGEAKNEVRQGAIKFNGITMTENHFVAIKDNNEVSIVEIINNSIK